MVAVPTIGRLRLGIGLVRRAGDAGADTESSADLTLCVTLLFCILLLLGNSLNAINARAAVRATPVPLRTIDLFSLNKANLLWSRVVIGILSIKQVLFIKTTRKVRIFRRDVAISGKNPKDKLNLRKLSHFEWHLSQTSKENTTPLGTPTSNVPWSLARL